MGHIIKTSTLFSDLFDCLKIIPILLFGIQDRFIKKHHTKPIFSIPNPTFNLFTSLFTRGTLKDRTNIYQLLASSAFL